MRISIRVQLALLVLLCSLIALMVLALAVVSGESSREVMDLTQSVVSKLRIRHQHPVRGLPIMGRATADNDLGCRDCP
jgi:hypothetical protein